MLKNIKVSFCQRCKDIIEDYYVAQRIAERSFIFDNNNAETHIKELYKIISHYYQEIITEFEKFIKKVKKSSSSNPQNYRTITTEDDYFSNLKDSIKLSQDRLSKKLEEKLKDLPPLLIYKNPGYIESLKFPLYRFEEDDIKRILRSLNQKAFDLTDTDINQRIAEQGWRFPIIQPHVIKFLLKIANNNISDNNTP